MTGTGTDTISGASTLEFELGGFEQHDGRLPEYRLHGRRHARSHRSHELLRRGFRFRGRRHGRASWLMGLFRFLREFGRHSGHAGARERHDHARFRLRRRLRAGRFQNYLGSDLDHHPHVTQRRRTRAQRPGGVRGLDQRLRDGRPLGDNEFQRAISRRLGRAVTPGKRGRKPKAEGRRTEAKG